MRPRRGPGDHAGTIRCHGPGRARGAGASERPKPQSKGRQRFARRLDRFGVPGASLLGPLALPTQFPSATLLGSGVSVPRVLLWQAAAIVLWTTFATLGAIGALALSGAGAVSGSLRRTDDGLPRSPARRYHAPPGP